MGCERFSSARVQAAYGESPDDPSWAEHGPDCYHCISEVGEMRELRGLYEAGSRRNLNRRSKARIVSALKRASKVRRLRAAAVAAVIFLGATLAVPGTRAEPGPTAAIPTAVAVDQGVNEVRDRVGKLEVDMEPPRPYVDAALDDLARRIRLLAWDTENENM